MPALNFHHLRYFWAVAKEGNLTRAARQLHVSQSALSAQIKQLETDLGQPLFQRTGRTLTLTEAGTKRRAALHVVDGEAALAAHDPVAERSEGDRADSDDRRAGGRLPAM